MKNKIILWVVPLTILIVLNVLAFFGEVFFAKIDWKYALLLRGSTIAIDGIFVGFYTYIRFKLRKKFRHKMVYNATIYISDTIAVLLIFYSLYLFRLVLFLHLEWIEKDSFIIDSIGGLLVAIFFGWLLAYITKKTKIKLKRYKKEWGYSTLFFIYRLIFYL